MKVPSHLKKSSWTSCPECDSKNVDRDKETNLDGDCNCMDCGFIWQMYVERR